MIGTHIWWSLTAITIPLALLLGLRLLVIERREHMQRLRLQAFRGPIRVPEADRPPSWTRELSDLLSPIIGTVEQQRVLKVLAAAGFKADSLANFIALKVVTGLAFAWAAWAVLYSRHLLSMVLLRIVVVGVVLIVSWRLPDLVLNRLVKRRRGRIEHGIPDALDLLVICAEAGLSLNQAIEEVSRQLRLSNQDVADEFATTSAEMRVLPDFGQALDNLVERSGLDNLRGLVATLKQSLRFGTSLSESLRTIAGEMRAERQARIEERAARLPVLLAVPMMAFILPCLLMIVGTPVVLRLIDTFKNLTFAP